MLSNKKMTLYYNTVRGDAKNTKYPLSISVNSSDDLRKPALYDHVCAQYKDNYRKKENFVQANCIMLDIDNTDSDDKSKWIYPADVQAVFSGVPFYIVYSRNHMRPKNGKEPRPKFHVYFPINTISNPKEYETLKNDVCAYFTAFDANAKDTARFFFGVEQPQIEYFEGNITLSEFMKKRTVCNTGEKESLKLPQKEVDVIPQGKRNSHLHKFAVRTLTRWGDNDNSHSLFKKEAERCAPPLAEKELNDIWKSALKYYVNVIQKKPDYILPEQYSNPVIMPVLKPDDFTDLGQMRVFFKEYGDKLRYSIATGFLFYTGTVWEENELKAHRLAQELTDRQLKEVTLLLKQVQTNENNAALNKDSSVRKKWDSLEKSFKNYRSHILKSRSTYRISAILKEIQPSIEISTNELDADGFQLNTPAGIVDLRSQEIHAHNPKNYCTKITAVSPSERGKELFADFLKVITCKDCALGDYLQLMAGMCLVGKVFCENLIIAYGTGKNGKSTFFNLLAQVLGDYAGSLSAETLTSECRKNKSPEYAELRGKRVVISSELEEDMSLNTAIVKKLCSTDRIYAEKKYKAPFDFEPTHTLILCTNHLPRVCTSDTGTWRRLVIVPFNAVIENYFEIKNYAEYLFENAGEAVLNWMIEGAKKFINTDYKIIPPKSVRQAIEQYRIENDWLQNYLSERCEIDSTFIQPSGKLHEDYRSYCKETGEPAKSMSSFKKAIQEAGFSTKKTNKGSFVYGLRLLDKCKDYRTVPAYFESIMTRSDGETKTYSEEDIEF